MSRWSTAVDDSSDDDGPPAMSNLINKEQKVGVDGGAVDDTDVDDARPRQCTDLLCLFIFVMYLCFMGHVYLVADDKGDVNKLLHGIDWQGRICGVHDMTKHQPYLYWCSTGGAGVSDGICVDKCPSAQDLGNHRCPSEPQQPTVTKSILNGSSGDYKITMTLERTMTEHRDVPTVDFLGMYCFPEAKEQMMKTILARGEFQGVTNQLVSGLRGVYESRWFLLGVAFGTVFLNFAFLMLLGVFVDVFIWVIISVCWILLAAATAYFMYGAVDERANVFVVYMKEHAKICTLVCAGISAVLFFVYSCVICCSCQAIKTSSRAIKKACRTIQHLPTLMFEPAINLLWKAVVWLAMLYGLNMIASMGHIVPSQMPWDEHTAGVTVAGVGRKVELEDWQWRYLFLWIFGSVWIVEVVNAAGQFALSHAVVMFTLNKDDSCRTMPLIVGYCNAFLFHLGTLAFAGFVIGVLKILTAVAAWISKQAHNPDGTPNMAVRAACCCCALCLKCLQRIMRMTNELAYVDTVIRGTSYPRAAKNVFKMFITYPGDLTVSTSMAKAVRNIGTVVIGGCGTWLAHWALTSKWLMSTMASVMKGSSSVLYTSSILGSTIASGMICFGISATFMVSFNQVANTLTYCIIWRKHCGVDATDLESDDEGESYERMS